MLRYVKLIDGLATPYSVQQLRRDNPQVAFQKDPTDATLAEWGVYPVVAVEAPEFDASTQTADNTVELVDGVWTEQWTVRDLTEEERFDRIPKAVTPAQGQLALLQAGLLDTVEAWVASQSRAVQIEYKARTEWKRDWPLVIEAATALGLTEAQLDDLFALAATL